MFFGYEIDSLQKHCHCYVRAQPQCFLLILLLSNSRGTILSILHQPNQALNNQGPGLLPKLGQFRSCETLVIISCGARNFPRIQAMFSDSFDQFFIPTISHRFRKIMGLQPSFWPDENSLETFTINPLQNILKHAGIVVGYSWAISDPFHKAIRLNWGPVTEGPDSQKIWSPPPPVNPFAPYAHRESYETVRKYRQRHCIWLFFCNHGLFIYLFRKPGLWAMAQAFCSKSANFDHVDILPKTSQTIIHAVRNHWQSCGQGFRSLVRFPTLSKISHFQNHGPRHFVQNQPISTGCKFSRNPHKL